MPEQVVIENPILNTPFEEPRKHFRFTEDGITDEVVEARRVSSYFVPIPRAKKKNPRQMSFETEWTADRVKENEFINRVRGRVSIWRTGGYQGVTKTTARLLAYWQRSDRDRKLFFCQVEALETAIFITEVAGRYGDAWIENEIRRANEDANPLLFRIAFKMATGSGKTLVMAMLIAWHALNKLADPQNARFSDAFLIAAPGITIRDRLRVLLPSDPNNYYRHHDLVPVDLMQELGKAKLVITNFHTFILKEKISAGKLTKEILGKGKSPFTETPDQMVRRVCRELGTKRNIIVINDEAHHCYRRKPDVEEERLVGDERKEVEKRDQEARIWISGLEAVKNKIGVKAVYDLSATPFFLRGSGYDEGTLFPWVVSDFSLIDAIESGIVKVPRVPVSDDSMLGEQPTYRDLWLRIREELPKKGRGTQAISGEPKLPAALEGALHSLYSNYQKNYQVWEQNTDAQFGGLTPPVFIVVCNNTNVSKLVFDYIAGWEKQLPDGSLLPVPGRLGLFSNVESGQWLARPNSILIDSEQLESGESMSPDFKKIAARQIDEFKAEYRARFPGRDAENLTDEDLLREVMNTVGKPGKLGEQVKCVVSVSMLTEGWDANTVTHILGVRAFGTQLLCEQVVGRGLRRMSYATNGDGFFEPEYAEVYGVPFSFIPSSGSTNTPKPGPTPTRVRALENRIECEITFPRLIGYRYELAEEQLTAEFSPESCLALSTRELPTKTEMASIIGESRMHTLYGLRERREQEVDFRLASLVMEKYFHDPDGNAKPWLFPQLLRIARRWRQECLTCQDNTFPQMLLITEFAHDAADRIYKAIAATRPDEKRLLPILRPFDSLGSTRYVDFDTTRPVYRTDPNKCHISHVVADTESWEQKMAQVLEEMDEVVSYVKNHNLGFTIPYTINGEERAYVPDFVVRLRVRKAFDTDLKSTLTPARNSTLTPALSQREREEEGSYSVEENRSVYKTALPAEFMARVRELRRNETDAERLFWSIVRDRQFLGYKFRRQHPVNGFILDFYCHQAKLGIELDGGQHFEPENAQYDEERSNILKELGIRVVRFRNDDVLQNTQAVMVAVERVLVDDIPDALREAGPQYAAQENLGAVLSAVVVNHKETLTPTLSQREREEEVSTLSPRHAPLSQREREEERDTSLDSITLDTGHWLGHNNQIDTSLPIGDDSSLESSPLGRGQGEGSYEFLNLIIEVSGEARKDKAAKVSTARNLWIPAVNNHGGFGKWAFVEISDPWDAKNTIRAFIIECIRSLIL